MDEAQWKISLVAEVVAAYVRGNAVAVSDLSRLILNVHGAFASAGVTAESPVPTVVKPTAAEIRKSITPDALISFLDGKSYKMLKPHLSMRDMTFDEYKVQFGLPSDYPKTAPSYSATRSALAKAFGLGAPRRLAHVVTPVPKRRAKKA